MEEEMHLTLKGKKRQSKNINIRDDIVIIRFHKHISKF